MGAYSSQKRSAAPLPFGPGNSWHPERRERDVKTCHPPGSRVCRLGFRGDGVGFRVLGVDCGNGGLGADLSQRFMV